MCFLYVSTCFAQAFLTSSRGVFLRSNHGNLSGASNLAVLDHHNQMAKTATSEWALCLSMGPGVCLEGLILRNIRKSTVPALSSSKVGDTPRKG